MDAAEAEAYNYGVERQYVHVFGPSFGWGFFLERGGKINSFNRTTH